MTGPTKAIVIIALAVIVMVSLNIAMWRRMRAGLAAARAADRQDQQSQVPADDTMRG